MSTLVQVTTEMSEDDFLALSAMLDRRYPGWGIKSCTVKHVDKLASFVLFLECSWKQTDETFFVLLAKKKIIARPHELVSLQAQRSLEAQAQSVKNAFQDLLAGLFIYVGSDGIHEETCFCDKIPSHQGVCPYCWSRHMYEVYRFACYHLL